MKIHLVTILILGVATIGVATAQTAYDAIDGNTSGNYLGPGPNVPILDDTQLTTTANLTSVDIQMNSVSSVSDTVTLYIYDSLGTPANGFTGGPGNLLFSLTQSANLSVGLTNLNFSLAGANISSTALWTGISDTAAGSGTGMELSDNVSVGSSTDNYAELTNSGWADYYFNGNPVANFAIRYNTQAAPEPTSYAIFGLGLVALIVRRRK